MLGTAVCSVLEQFALGDATHEFLRRDEEELSLECRRVLEQAIVLREHVDDHLTRHVPVACIADEVRAAHALARVRIDDVHAHDLMLLVVAVVL